MKHLKLFEEFIDIPKLSQEEKDDLLRKVQSQFPDAKVSWSLKQKDCIHIQWRTGEQNVDTIPVGVYKDEHIHWRLMLDILEKMKELK